MRIIESPRYLGVCGGRGVGDGGFGGYLSG